MRDLTPRQKQILLLVQKTMHETGMPPTRAEIAKTLKFRSVNAAEEHLRALERKGVIELLPGMSRGIRLKDSHARANGFAASRSCCCRSADSGGRAHRGSLIKSIPQLFKKPPHFLLRVHGMSMRDAGILDGDLVAVHRTPEVRTRQIVVARLENEVTVKRYQARRPPRLVDAGESGVCADSSGSARAIDGHRRCRRRRRARRDEVTGRVLRQIRGVERLADARLARQGRLLCSRRRSDGVSASSIRICRVAAGRWELSPKSSSKVTESVSSHC